MFYDPYVKPRELNQLNEGGFAKSKIAEHALFTLLANTYNLDAHVNSKMEYDPTGDGEINGILCEIKFSSVGKGNEGYPIFFETHSKDGYPSALLLTHSRYYLTVTPGYSHQLLKVIGKIRCWPVSYLLQLEKQLPKEQVHGGRVAGFYIKPKDHPCQVWLGDVPFNNLTFDLNSIIIKQKPEIVHQIFQKRNPTK